MRIVEPVVFVETFAGAGELERLVDVFKRGNDDGMKVRYCGRCSCTFN
jgi:hypothetical protein